MLLYGLALLVIEKKHLLLLFNQQCTMISAYFVAVPITNLNDMDKYIVSARKYRPTNFDSVVGQHSLTVTLKNAIVQGKLAHAYLFCGPRGVGKTTCARIFAKNINCLTPTSDGEACNQCESCVAFNENRSYNIHELDAASNNSVEDIRELIEQVQIPPQVGKYKVFIIDEVHMLSAAAFNAFLKTLEEPPTHAIFILATTEKHKILPTILSRCQIYDFARMTVADTVKHLQYVADKEGYTCEPEALHVIAEKADGGMRDALSIFDQVASFCEGNITYQKVIEDLNVLDYAHYFAMTDDLLEQKISDVLVRLAGIIAKGFEANYFIGGLAAHFRNLLMSRDKQTLPLLEVSEQVRNRYHEQAMRCTPKVLYRALKLCNDCDINYRAARNKRLLVELTLIEIAQACSDDDDGACGRRPVRRLKPIFQTASAPSAAAATDSSSVHYVTASGTDAPKVQDSDVSLTSTPSPTVPPTLSRLASLEKVSENSAAVNARKNSAKTLSIRSLHERPNNVGGTSHTGPTPTSEGMSPASSIIAVPAGSTSSNNQYSKLNTPFQLDTLVYYWHRFANQLPRTDSATAGRMRTMQPKICEDYVVEVEVENSIVEEYMRNVQISLMNYLRTNLRNDYITLRFIHPQGETQHSYTRFELFQDMRKQYPALDILCNELSLELA